MDKRVKQKLDVIMQICDAVIDAVKLSESQGVPGGTLYAALMPTGCTFETYEQLMGILVRSGRIVKRGQLYFYVDITPEGVKKLPDGEAAGLRPETVGDQIRQQYRQPKLFQKRYST